MNAQVLEFRAEPYVYESLPTASSIRLLSVLRKRSLAPVISGTPLIECTIRTVDLDHHPAYKALSYTWGNPFHDTLDPEKDKYSEKHRCPVSVNGRLLYIRLSLYEALNRFSAWITPDHDGIGIDTRLRPYNKTRLIKMAEEGCLQEVTDCLAYGANISVQDCFGETALHYAAENGHLEVTRVLLRHGAKMDMLDNTGRTPLACCLQHKRGDHEDVAKVLLNPRSTGAIVDRYEFIQHEMWVDSLCINQDDIQERNCQIAGMARIFKAATSVRVWLGPEDGNTQLVHDILNRSPLETDGQAITDKDLGAIQSFFRRSWFKRKWVIQEMCLAGSIEMYSGRFHLNAIAAGFNSVGSSTTGRSLPEIIRQVTPLFELRAWIIRELAWHFKSYVWWGSRLAVQRISLVALIRLTWDFRAADPRDCIFALLGIIPETSKKTQMAADYSRSAADVFTEAGRLFIEAKRGHKRAENVMEPLEGLSWVCHPQEDGQGQTSHLSFKIIEGKPTWVPNFHVPMHSTVFWNRRFQACGPKSLCKILPSERHLLRIDGLLLDRVVEVEGRAPSRNSATPISVDNIFTWFEMILKLDARYHGICSRVEAFWRTLIADDLGSDSSAEVKDGFKRLVCTVMQSLRDQDRVKAVMSHLSAADGSDSLPTWKDIEAFEVDGEAPVHSCGPRCFGYSRWDSERCGIMFYQNIVTRELILTERGYVGLAPRSVQVGDQVWILAGGRTPFILRPISDDPSKACYQFVGESYIHGIMYGEAVQKARRSKLGFSPIDMV